MMMTSTRRVLSCEDTLSSFVDRTYGKLVLSPVFSRFLSVPRVRLRRKGEKRVAEALGSLFFEQVYETFISAQLAITDAYQRSSGRVFWFEFLSLPPPPSSVRTHKSFGQRDQATHLAEELLDEPHYFVEIIALTN